MDGRALEARSNRLIFVGPDVRGSRRPRLAVRQQQVQIARRGVHE